MKTTKRMWNGTFTLLCTGMAIMTSCAPINRFTRIKQVPREYIMNYCGGEIKAPSSLQIKNNPWIVFSDQLGNMSYQTATGKNEMKELQFMDAFLVVGKRKLVESHQIRPDTNKATGEGWATINQQSIMDGFINQTCC